jgi:hypothetical protein
MLSSKQLRDIHTTLMNYEADLLVDEHYHPERVSAGALERCTRARQNVHKELLLVERKERITSAGR